MQQQAPKEFLYKPYFSIWFLFKSGKKLTDYSMELRNTPAQIKFRKQTPVIDIKKGLDELLENFEDKKDSCALVRIYLVQEVYNLDKESIMLMQWHRTQPETNFNNIKELDIFKSEEKLKELETWYIQWIYNRIQNATTMIDYSRRKQKSF